MGGTQNSKLVILYGLQVKLQKLKLPLADKNFPNPDSKRLEATVPMFMQGREHNLFHHQNEQSEFTGS